MQAEAERRSHEMTVKQILFWPKTLDWHPVRTYAQGVWQIFTSIAPHTRPSALLFEPLIWQPFPDRVFIVRPGIFLVEIKETCSPLVIVLVIQFARDEFPIFQAHAIILLTALATKYQRQEHALAITWYILLSLQRQVAFLLYRGINRITFADELVQTEGERRSACFWMRFTCISGKQRLLDSLNTLLDRLASEITQLICSALLT